MTARSRRLAVAAATGLALVLAGCSGSDEPDEPEVGPIEELFSGVYGDWDEDDFQAQMRQVEELAAQCMAEQGFEYIPVDHSQQSFSSDDLEVEWGTLEFAEQYGYGATTNPWEEQQQAIDEGAGDWEDPNWAIVEAMSESEQDAYWTALYGNQEYPDEDEMEAEWEYRWEENGCQGWAQHQVYELDDVDPSSNEEFAGLQQEMEMMWDAMQADPRFAELDSQWAACMADAGYPGFTEVYDAEESIYEATNVIWEGVWEGMPEDAGEDQWLAAEQAAQAELASLTEREIATAVADYTCREEVDLEPTQRRIALEYEQEFYDAHRTELEAWAETFRRE